MEYWGRNCSWIMKAILKCRERLAESESWRNLQAKINFSRTGCTKSYVVIRSMCIGGSCSLQNVAMSQAAFIMWMACHVRLNTQNITRWSLVLSLMVVVVVFVQSPSLLTTSSSNVRILAKLGVKYWKCWRSSMDLAYGKEEFIWVLKATQGKSPRARMVKMAFPEKRKGMKKFLQQRVQTWSWAGCLAAR